MKIVTTGPHAAAVAKPRAAGGGGAAGGAGFAPRTGGERPAPAGGGGVAPGAPLTALGALLAAQEVPEVGGGGGRRRAARRGHDLLDRLDELRLALLEGGVPEPTLRRLVALLEERAGPVDDPRLGAVLHEIEVRAAVELAKLERG